MADLTLRLPPGLSERLKLAASKEAKEPEVLIIEVLEHFLEEPSLEFIGAWAESHITPATLRVSRTLGSMKQAFQTADFDAETAGDSLLEPMSEEELKEWYDNPIFGGATS